MNLIINRILKNSGLPDMAMVNDIVISQNIANTDDKLNTFGDIFTDEVPQYIYIYEDVPRQNC